LGIKYHQYFYKALQQHFKDHIEKLNIQQEIYLAEEPIRIDYLIIKKDSNMNLHSQIKNKICKWLPTALYRLKANLYY
jgi:hypothetical protein